MPESVSDLESRLAAVERRLGGIERRLARIDAAGSPETGFVGDQNTPPTTNADARGEGDATGLVAEFLPLAGRTLVVLGGAFLLRAVTEGSLVPQVVGTGLGIAYAIVWLMAADRTAARGLRISATFHGLVAVGIVFPLLWEATVKFGYMTPAHSAAVLALVAAIGLAVACRQRLTVVAWFVSLGTALTALALAVPTKSWSMFVFELLVLALAVMWLAYRRNWQPMAWTLGGLISTTIFLMTTICLGAPQERAWELFSSDMLLAIQLSWVVVFVGALGYRKLTTREDLTLGEILSGIVVLAVGFGGATAVTRLTAVSGVSLGVVSLALAAGAYGVAFAVADRQARHRRSFIFYSSVALLVTLVASITVMHGPALTITFAAVALLTAWLGYRRARATLSLHSAVYILAAAASSGLLAGTVATFVDAGPLDGAWITPSVMLVMAVAGVFVWLPVASHGRTWGRFSSIPKIVVSALFLLSVVAVAETLAARALPADERGLLASLRTAALALAAVTAAWLGRMPRWPEASRLVYPLLAIGGLKLVVQDLPAGRPLTLFLSFGIYGVALIVAPRLARRGS